MSEKEGLQELQTGDMAGRKALLYIPRGQMYPFLAIFNEKGTSTQYDGLVNDFIDMRIIDAQDLIGFTVSGNQPEEYV